MRRTFMASMATLLLLGGSSVLAQNTTTTAKRPARSATTNDRRAAADQKVTVAGCVERADQILSRENLGTTVDSLSFVLIKADDSGRKLGDKTYRLAAAIDTLNRHVGHKVEISGMMAPAGTSGTTASNNGVVGVGVPPIVRVQSIRMLAPTCGR